jgi:arylsulfatase A-like enzyme
MIRRNIFQLFCIIAWVAVAGTSATAKETALGKPNIIFILADDWGLGDVKTYGGDRCKIDTPNMDQLAADGMKFMDAHTSSSVCTPSRYSVLTGRYNWRSKLKMYVLKGFSKALIEPNRQTVPSFLKDHDYNTAMIGKWHLGMQLPTTDGKSAKCTATTPEELKTKCNVDWKGTIKEGPNSIGFDYYWGISASLDMPPYIWIENDRFVGECTTIKAFHRPGPAHADFEDYDVLPTLANKSAEYITKQARTQEPFFLYMPLNSPHTPISPSKAFQGKSKQGNYGDFVMETDWAVGQVVKAVEDAGIADNTLIIVTADNGCSPQALKSGTKKNIHFRMGENEPDNPTEHYPSDIYRGHKADIYEGGHRVPYIARWDGKVKAGSQCSDPVCLVDLYATCADILGAAIAEDAAEDSVSLLPNLLGTAKGPVREAVVHHSINGSFAIRKGNWKLNFCPASGGWSDPRPKDLVAKDVKEWVQLFDLANDPAETTNLASKHPETVVQLTTLAQQYIDNGRSTPGPDQKNNGKTHLYPEWIRKAQK